MAEQPLFISSCSRRELSRRRPSRAVSWPGPAVTGALRLRLAAAAYGLVCVAAFAAGRAHL